MVQTPVDGEVCASKHRNRPIATTISCTAHPKMARLHRAIVAVAMVMVMAMGNSLDLGGELKF
jgi:hypothetical protein